MDRLEFARQNIEKIDKQIANLLIERMEMSKIVCEYKYDNNLSIKDQSREDSLISKNLKFVKNPLKPYYEKILRSIIDESCSFQDDLMSAKKTSYINSNVVVSAGGIEHVSDYVNLDRKVLIITDSGVPVEYSKIVFDQCKNASIYVFEQGEKNKNYKQLEKILIELSNNGFTRNDLIIAVGGGVVGDMAGLAASIYMRGIDFVNIPTTLLSQVDSSIGGKTAIDFAGYKNIIGAFHMPVMVIVDPNVLKTLPDRQFNNGLCEAIKMAATNDKDLFEFIENCKDINENIEKVIIGALKIKNHIVKIDPKEKGLRRVLNFGHTIGHAIESAAKGKLLHGECVSIGMLFMCDEDIKMRLEKVLKKYDLPTVCNFSKNELIDAICHDKKKLGDEVCVVYVDVIGDYKFNMLSIQQIINILENK